MRILLTILLLISIAYGQDTIPMRITFINSSGSVKTIKGFGILVSDTAMNRARNIPEIDSLPHYVLPSVFLNARKRQVTNKVINFEPIFK